MRSKRGLRTLAAVCVGFAVLLTFAIAGSPGSVRKEKRPTDRSPVHSPSAFRERLRPLLELASKPCCGETHRATALLGRSAKGRPIHVRELVGAGWPSRPRILVFGCIHGDECAGTKVARNLAVGCPPPVAEWAVPNLNPDGLEDGTRLNGRGVDLNRNFPHDWRPIGSRYDPEYSGPRPFSEPETRLAARLIRLVHPKITVWFHQEAQPMVRAWGQSVPAAKRYAKLSGLPFRHLHWLAGTAPNWQNHRFPGTSSFVVELPPGPLSFQRAGRLASATFRLATLASEHAPNGD